MTAAEYLTAIILSVGEAVDEMDVLAGEDCQDEIEAMRKAMNEALALVTQMDRPNKPLESSRILHR